MLIYLPTAELMQVMHDHILEVAGGRPGVLSHNKIEAAVHRPKTYLSYHDNCDLHTIAAVLMDSFARNHAFVDGNKRTGLMAALLIYELNGYTLRTGSGNNIEFEEIVLWVVKEKPKIEEIAARLKVLIKKHATKKVSKYLYDVKALLTPYDSDK